MFYDVSDQLFHDGVERSRSEATRTLIGINRVLRDDSPQNSHKAKQEELRFLRSTVKVLEKYVTSISTIESALNTIQAWIYVMKSGDRRQTQV